MQRFTATSIALFASLLQTTPGLAKTYLVRSGDTLSGIAHRELGGPVYGKSGSLQKIIDMNSDIKNPNRIYPSQKVLLAPEETASPVAEVPAAPEPAPSEAAAAETAVAANAAAEVSPATFGFSVHGILSGSSLSVTAKDRSYKTNLDSKLNKGLQLRGHYFLNEHSMVGVQIKAVQTEFSDTSDGRFVGREKLLKELAAFYQLSFASDWRIELSAGSAQALFLAQNAADSFRLESAFVDYVAADLEYDLYKGEALRWSLGINSAYNAGVEARTVDVDAGYSYGATSGVAYTLRPDSYLEAGLFYDRRIQDTDDAKQKAAESGLTLGLRLDY